MIASISKSIVRGVLDAPSSKSYTIRALICAALSNGPSYIRRPLKSDDTLATLNALRAFGINIYQNEYGWRVYGGELKAPSTEIDCRDSAATLRFMTAVSALVPGTVKLIPSEGLSKRPILPLIDAMSQLGVKVFLDNNIVVVEGGDFLGGSVSISGDISSQFISALLMAGPLSQHGINIKLTTPLLSQPYVNMTIECLKKHGVRVNSSGDMSQLSIAKQKYLATDSTVEGDWSQASYIIGLGVLSGETITSNLNAESVQGDRIAVSLIQRMGARLSVRRSSVMAQKSYFMHSICADMSHSIDLLPTMAVLASVADGNSTFLNIQSARLKESDRVEAVCTELAKMGIRTIVDENTLTVIGGIPHGAEIDSHKDHRIAMAFGILGTMVGDTVIHGAECVEKTYPGFWRDISTLGAKVECYDKQLG